MRLFAVLGIVVVLCLAIWAAFIITAKADECRAAGGVYTSAACVTPHPVPTKKGTST